MNCVTICNWYEICMWEGKSAYSRDYHIRAQNPKAAEVAACLERSGGSSSHDANKAPTN